MTNLQRANQAASETLIFLKQAEKQAKHKDALVMRELVNVAENLRCGICTVIRGEK